MPNSQLVPVSSGTIGNIHCLTINGRSLHGVLGVRRDFTTWIKGRIRKYGFLEKQDFEVFTNSGENSEGGRPSQEYTLTTDMGKELCMVENNEAGRVARRYFIECERALLEGKHGEPVALPPTDTPITPDQQCTLQGMVRALVDKGGIYANIWSRFNNHFRLGSYKQLPQSRMSEAVAYLMQLDVSPRALPEAKFIITLEEQVAPHFEAMRTHTKAIAEHERSIYKIIRGAAVQNLNQTGLKHSTLANSFWVMDSLWYAIDRSLESAEVHTKIMCDLCRM